MNEMYAEASVKCVMTAKDYARIAGFVAAILVSLILGLVVSPFIFVVAIGLITYAICKVGQLKYEYEYVFCDGQLDFDKIMGNAKRKRMMRIDFDTCEVIAIEGSMALDQWNNKKLKEYDFTSHTNEKKPFVVIAHKDKELVRIVFEPNEKMVQCMRDKSRRLVHVQ